MVWRPSGSSPSGPNVLPACVERWCWRRFASAGIATAAALVAAHAGHGPLTGVLLSLAAAVAVVTLVGRAWLRHGGRGEPAAPAAAVAGALIADLAVMFVVLHATPVPWVPWVASAALLIAALELRLLLRLQREQIAAVQEHERAALCAAREPVGIVRARIDALRLMLGGRSADPQVEHELALLEEQADAAQERLRRSLPAPASVDSPPRLSPGSPASGRDRQQWPSESRPTPS